jgi:tetratricopeptide (TPR) repeat protein
MASVYGAIAARDYAAADAWLTELKALPGKPAAGPAATAALNQFEVIRRVAQGQDDRALKLAEGPLPYKVLSPAFNFSIAALVSHNLPFEVDHAAQVLARRGAVEAALQEYRTLMTVAPENYNRRLVHPIYHFRVAALFEKQGDKGKAADEYRTFLRLWKDADAGLPEPAEARKRLAALGI